MAKFLVLWNINPSVTPQTDPKERLNGNKAHMGMVLKDLEEGKVTDWGAWASGGNGYCIIEGTAEDIPLTMVKYAPWVQIEAHQVLSANEWVSVIDKLIAALP